ncbi:MAG TPA: 1-acyl-sn-glycerol-3-phosphate acyltransferase [Acidimicrobiales bacterium]|nr:1-acyl-sn-glycerol-3-phosphate acyltransferase [Acidimicrobiales bacterium]
MTHDPKPIHKPSGKGFASGEGLAARIFYHALRLPLVAILKIWFRATIEGTENIPRNGAYIVCPVHRSYVDTPLMGIFPRHLRFMGKDAMWRSRALGTLLSALGGFPVSRNMADREALATVVKVVEEGEPAVMFPEGERKSGPRVFPLKDGPAYVAARCGVPILPVGVGGSERAMPKGSSWVRPTKIHVIIGEPLAPPPRRESGRVSRKGVREKSTELREAIQVLFDRAQEHVGLHNDYEPGSEPQDPPEQVGGGGSAASTESEEGR